MYLPGALASSIYLPEALASSIYLPEAIASSIYLPEALASSIYLPEVLANFLCIYNSHSTKNGINTNWCTVKSILDNLSLIMSSTELLNLDTIYSV